MKNPIPAQSLHQSAREGRHRGNRESARADVPARAKNVIMLFMEGGPGHMDTFDPKPKLGELHKTESKLKAGQETGFKFFVGSPFKFNKAGQNGIEMCDQWKYLADPFIADELCNYRGCQAESLNHPEALFHMNTGSRLGGQVIKDIIAAE